MFTLEDDPRCVDQMCFALSITSSYSVSTVASSEGESAAKSKSAAVSECGAGSGHLMDMAVYVHLYTCGDVMLT